MRIMAVLAGLGGVLAGGLALVARSVSTGSAQDYGWYSYDPLPSSRRYVDYLPTDVTRPWWPVFAALGAGLVFGALVGLALHLLGFRLVREC